MSTPTQALPTDVYVVDEQRLPFYMTQDQNGQWVKVDNAWLLYGRQAGVRRMLIGGLKAVVRTIAREGTDTW
jgi:hypothetical protein